MLERIVLPATPPMGRIARSAVRAVLDEHGASPRVTDLLAVVGEFTADAIRSGASMEITVEVKPGWARVEVHATASAGPWVDPETGDAYRLGLLLLEGCADRWGRDRAGVSGTWWAEWFWETL